MKSPGQLPMALDTSLRQVPFTMLGFLRTAIAKLRSRNSRSSKIGLAARGVVGSGFVHFRAFVVLALGVVLNCTGRRSATELRWCRWGLASKQCLLRAPN